MVLDESLQCAAIQMKATEQSFHVVLFVMLLSGIGYYAALGGSNV